MAQPRHVPAFVLCGGLGTRLAGVEDRTKAIIPVAGRPFLTYVLRLLRLQGFARTVLCLGRGAEAVRRVIRGSGLTFSIEPEPLGTGGALALAGGEAARTNLILNGDSYAEAYYPDLLATHAGHGAAAGRAMTLLAVRVADTSDYGGLEVDAEGRVISFREKGGAGAGWINAGVYVAGGALLRALPGGTFSLERDLLPELAAEGRLRALTGRFFFRDIGTPARLPAAQEEFRWLRRRMEEAP